MKSGLLLATTLMTTMGCTDHFIDPDSSQLVGISTSVVFVQSTWQPFTSPTGLFWVQLPGEPNSEILLKEIEEEVVKVHQISFINETGVYAVLYGDLPSSYTETTDENTILDEMGAWILAEKQLEDLAELEQPITLKNQPGREFAVSNENGALIVRVYLVNQRIYFLLTASEKVNDVNQFLRSFQFL